nr:ribosomal protein S15 [Meconopsis simplicifolia]WBF92688.1 ribosomal protein S15 [Meconopsis simplicifolia]
MIKNAFISVIPQEAKEERGPLNFKY